LDISSTGIGNEGMDMICDILMDENLNTLHSLNISMNEINNLDVMEKLKQGLIRSALKELDLSYNFIGNKGIRLIAQSLATKNFLEKLNITCCKFTYKGATPLF
jgi:Ran GTPase-activating protein (RanGAP) involved in mRNA processing and transport